jgi:hypothetical protein
MHFIEGDTDSAYWAIAGDPTNPRHNEFADVVKNWEFYNRHVYEWFPDPTKGLEDKKKLLGLCIEKEAENCIALAPKCYTLFDGDIEEVTKTYSMKVKGVSQKKNPEMTPKEYLQALLGKPYVGINVGLQPHKGSDGVTQMKKIMVRKNALTSVHTKMYCLPNHSCHCFIHRFV